MDIFEQLLVQLEQTITGAKGSLLSNANAVVDRAEILDLVNRIRDAYPNVIREAQHIVQECDGYKKDAIDYAQRIVSEAEQRRNKMLDESEIIRVATEEANEIKRVANDIRTRMLFDAKVKADKILEETEVSLSDAWSLVRSSREELRKEQSDAQSQQTQQAPVTDEDPQNI